MANKEILLNEPGIKEIDEYEQLRIYVLEQLFLKQRDEASEALVDQIMKDTNIYTIRDDKFDEMWIYSEGIYIPQGKTHIKEFCRKILGKAYTAHLVNLVIDKISTETYITDKDFFVNKNIQEIALENGILNVSTREMSEFTPDKVFFNKHPITYDSTKECPKIEKFFNEIITFEEDLNVLYELFGFLLYREYFIEKAIMMKGEGRNGKSKILDLMKRFIGPDNCANVPLQDLESNNNFAISELLHKMANLSGDLSSSALKHTGNFKSAVGRDLLSGNRKNQTRVHFVNYAKFIYAANDLPIPEDKTSAFWDRWVLLDFPYRFLSQKEIDLLPEDERDDIKLADIEIINKISSKEEMSGLLNKALEGLDRLMKSGDFSYNKSTEQIKLEWMRNTDSFSGFFLERCEESYDGEVEKKEIKRVYEEYCRENRVRPLTNSKIKANLAERGVWDVQKSDGTYVWKGIKLNEPKLSKELNLEIDKK